MEFCPPLAALNFSSPVMLLGLSAAAIPVVLHLLNRLRSPVVPFSTLRFLRNTAQKTARRRHLENILLLLLRMAVFALLAMAVAGPWVRGGSPELAYGLIGLLLAGVLLMVIPGVLLFQGVRRAPPPPPAQRKNGVSSRPAETHRDAAGGSGRPRRGRFPSTAAMLALMILGLLGVAGSFFGLSSNWLFAATGGPYDGSSTAAVIILDNSQSMLARAGAVTRLARAVQQTRVLLNTVLRPAQMAVLLTNPGPGPRTNALSAGRIAVLGRLDHMIAAGSAASVGQALPMARLITQAVRLLHRSGEVNQMLVIVSDFAGPAASDAGMFHALKAHRRIQLVLMPQAHGSIPDDVGIAKFQIVRGPAVVGSRLTFRATVLNNGQTAVAPRFALKVDGVPVKQPVVQARLTPVGTIGRRRRIRLQYQLVAAGYHRFTLAQIGPADALPWADRRTLVLRVARRVKTLVVGNQADAACPDSAAFYVQTALAPFGAAPSSETTPSPRGETGRASRLPWGIQPTYIFSSQLRRLPLEKFRAIFICDVPRLAAVAVARLTQFVQGGGRLCWLLGPAVDPVAYNAHLSGPARIFPGQLLGPAQSVSGQPIDWVNLKSHIFAGLFKNQAPFRRIIVVGRWKLQASASASETVLCRLPNQAAILIAQSFGQGRVYTFLTAPAGGWTNWAATTSFLPIIVRIALGTAAGSRQNSYEPQQQVRLMPAGVPFRETLNIQQPGSGAAPINIPPTRGPGGRPQWLFDHTYRAGLYHWWSFDHRFSGEFVVNKPAAEVDLHAVAAHLLAREASTRKPVLIAASARHLAGLLAKSSRGSSLMPGVLALVLILAVMEALLANRYQPVRPAVMAQPSSNRRGDILARQVLAEWAGSTADTDSRSKP